MYARRVIVLFIFIVLFVVLFLYWHKDDVPTNNALPQVYAYRTEVESKNKIGSNFHTVPLSSEFTVLGESHGIDPEIMNFSIYETKRDEFVMAVTIGHWDRTSLDGVGRFYILFVVEGRVVSVIDSHAREFERDAPITIMSFISPEAAKLICKKFPTFCGSYSDG